MSVLAGGTVLSVLAVDAVGAVLAGCTGFSFVTGIAFVAFFTGGLCAGISVADPPASVLADEGRIAVFTGGTALPGRSVKSLQGRNIIQVQPHLIANITPLKHCFIYPEFRRFSVLPGNSVLPGRSRNIR